MRSSSYRLFAATFLFLATPFIALARGVVWAVSAAASAFRDIFARPEAERFLARPAYASEASVAAPMRARVSSFVSRRLQRRSGSHFSAPLNVGGVASGLRLAT